MQFLFIMISKFSLFLKLVSRIAWEHYLYGIKVTLMTIMLMVWIKLIFQTLEIYFSKNRRKHRRRQIKFSLRSEAVLWGDNIFRLIPQRISISGGERRRCRGQENREKWEDVIVICSTGIWLGAGNWTYDSINIIYTSL